MIVTYKDLYLGPGDDIWNEFIKKTVEPILEKSDINPNIIPPENIIISSIDEFDKFISIIYENNYSAGKILEKMIIDNRNPQTKKWTFSQHLENYINSNFTHPLLDKEHDNFANEIAQKSKDKNI